MSDGMQPQLRDTLSAVKRMRNALEIIKGITETQDSYLTIKIHEIAQHGLRECAHDAR